MENENENLENQDEDSPDLRIAVFSWEALESIRVGGLAVAVSNLCRALAEKGHEVHLFTRRGEDQSDYDQVDGVHIQRCSFPLSYNIIELSHNLSNSMVERFHHVENQFGEFDLVHGHDWISVEALHQLQEEGYPSVLTYHSTEYGRNGGEFGDWWEFGEISSKEWYGGYVADRVTAVSNTLKRELMWLYNIPGWKMNVITNGGKLGEYKKDVDPGRVKERYGIHPLAPMILFIGRLEYQKGPDLLVKAIPHVLNNRWDAKFIIAGKGGMRDHLEYLADDLGVSDSVRILGYIPDEEYKDLLNACDMVCIPSRNEPFGLVLYEAWDAEKAVVATHVGGLKENIDNFENGIKIFPYPESVAWGINYIIDDPTGVEKLGKNGKEKLKKSTWPIIASQYEKTYSEILPEGVSFD